MTITEKFITTSDIFPNIDIIDVSKEDHMRQHIIISDVFDNIFDDARINLTQEEFLIFLIECYRFMQVMCIKNHDDMAVNIITDMLRRFKEE